MKKIIALFISLIGFTISPIAQAESEITVKIDDTVAAFSVTPQIINDRVMVPMREIFEYLGAEVEWNNDTRTASGTLCGITVDFTIDDPVITKNAVPLEIDVPATILNDWTYLSVRAVAESFGMQVDWYGSEKMVHIITTTAKLTEFETQGGYYYMGEAVDGVPDGYGTLLMNTEYTVYEKGRFSDGLLVEGVTRFQDGDLFIGSFSATGVFEHGSYFYSDGAYFVGSFSNGSLEYGTYYYADGDYYEGSFANGKKNGKGTYYWDNGNYHDGVWKDDLQNGSGTFYNCAYNLFYTGAWVNGNRHGEFTVYDNTTGETRTIYYDNGTLIEENPETYYKKQELLQRKQQIQQQLVECNDKASELQAEYEELSAWYKQEMNKYLEDIYSGKIETYKIERIEKAIEQQYESSKQSLDARKRGLEQTYDLLFQELDNIETMLNNIENA